MKTTTGTPKTIEQAIDNALTEALEEWGHDFIYSDVSGQALIRMMKDHLREFIANKATSLDQDKAPHFIELFERIFPKP